ISARLLAAISTDRATCSERHAGTVSQIKTLQARVQEANTERAALADAPAIFAEKRRGLMSEIEGAEAARRAAADRLAEGENALAEADRDARAALEAMGEAREHAARAEERFASDKRRLAELAHEIHEMLEVAPPEVAKLAGIDAGKALPEVGEVEANLERLRRERERLRAGNLRADRRSRRRKSQSLPALMQARRCPKSAKSRRTSNGCGGSASGSARSICVPRRRCARGRPSTGRSRPSAVIFTKTTR